MDETRFRTGCVMVTQHTGVWIMAGPTFPPEAEQGVFGLREMRRNEGMKESRNQGKRE